MAALSLRPAMRRLAAATSAAIPEARPTKKIAAADPARRKKAVTPAPNK